MTVELPPIAACLALLAATTVAPPAAGAEPTALAACYESVGCREYGLCWPASDGCVIHPNCREMCRKAGRCFFDGDSCVAMTGAACARSAICRDDDQCFFDGASQRCDDGRERNSPALMVVGIVSLGLGGLGLLVGLAMHLPYANSDCAGRSCATDALIFAGGGVLALGLPLTVAGAAKVPREQHTSSLIPEVAIGPMQGELVWRF